MRVVHRKEAMADAISEAKSEAGAAFDNDAVFIEKYENESLTWYNISG